MAFIAAVFSIPGLGCPFACEGLGIATTNRHFNDDDKKLKKECQGGSKPIGAFPLNSDLFTVRDKNITYYVFSYTWKMLIEKL
jgi:hypothetical protein